MTSQRLLSAAIVPLLGGIALATAQDKPQPKTPAGSPPTVSKQELKKEMPFCHKASDVIGSKVKNAKNEDLGKVEELVIEPSTGFIDYAVVSFGGFLGMGDKYFAVPFTLLKAPKVPESSDQAFFTFDVEKSRLEKAPGFDKNNWPDIAAANWSQEIDRFYNTTRARPAGAEGDDLSSGKKESADGAIEANKNTHLCKASELIGKTVENPQNDNLGEVKELVLDPRQSRVNYFVMKSGGFLGMGDKLFAIPWGAVKFDVKERKEKLVLNATKERFEKAPEYQDKDWKRMSDPVWVEEVYTYYGARPYWTSTHRIEK
jgi:sporulation protein YlmC with PRC-barrel domain